MKFHENPSSGRRVNVCGRTDGHDNASSHFTQIICIRRLKTKQYINFEALRKVMYVLYYYSFWIKSTDTQFQMYFGNTTVHVSGSPPAHNQELSTLQPALAHFMQVWQPLACRVRTLQARGRQTCIKCAYAGCRAGEWNKNTLLTFLTGSPTTQVYQPVFIQGI
jgi:hypothetical protein